jgi:hypothetical protein
MKTNVQINFSIREKILLLGGVSCLLLICLGGSALVIQSAAQKISQTQAGNINSIASTATTPVYSPSGTAGKNGGRTMPQPFVVKITAIVNRNGQRVAGWIGSGVVVAKDGLILTSAQVSRPGKPFPVADLLISIQNAADQPLQDMYYAEVVQANAPLDIAVVRIMRDLKNQPVEKDTLNLSAAPMADSDLLQAGDALTVAGVDASGFPTLRANQVNDFQQEAGVSLRAFLNLKTGETGSYSGSAVLDSSGRLVGIATNMEGASNTPLPACMQSIDTNRDGQVNAEDRCMPLSLPVKAARPVRLIQSLLTAAQRGTMHIEMERASQITLPMPGRILFADPFQAANSGWALNDSAAMQDGKFNIGVPSEYALNALGIAQPFADVRLDVNIAVDTPTGEGDYGALCRYSDAKNYYAMEVSEDGYYSIWKKQAGKITALVDWTETDALTPGSQPGHLTFTCIDDTLSIIQNGKLIGKAMDTALPTGGIGLVAGTWEKGGLAVSFRSLIVRSAGNQPERPLEILFQDDFLEPHESWWDLTRGGAFFNSGMRIQVNVPQKDLYVRSYQVYSNVRIEVDATPIGGPDDNDYGLICRYQEATHEFYYFEITADGKYQIGYYSASGTQVALSNAQFKPSSTIVPGKALNHIRVDCDGTSLVLFVNGTQIALVEDEKLRDGGVGMIAGTWDSPGTDIQFDNFYIYKP